MAINRDNFGSPYTPDYGLSIVNSEVPGKSFDHKFGYSPSVTTAEQTIWTGTNSPYLFPGSATYMALTSTVSADGTHGQGAKSVIVYGLNSAYAEVSEQVDFVTYGVSTTTNLYSRVHRITVTSAGTTGKNQGQIYLGNGAITSQAPANIFAHVASGNNQTLQTIYTIPASKTGYIYDIALSSTNAKNATIKVLARPEGQVFQVKKQFEVFQTAFERHYTLPWKFEAKTDIDFRAKSSAAGTTVSAEFDIVLIDNGT